MRRERGAIATTDFESKLNVDAALIEERVQTLSTNDLLERYHQLVDKQFDEGHLPYTACFELERIQARLDAEDQGELNRLAAIDDDRARQRCELLTSIESLVARLKAPQLRL